MDSALVDFGITGVSLRTLIEFLKTALKNSNAAVRTSATKALVTVEVIAGVSKTKLHQLIYWANSHFQVSRIF